MITSHPTNSNNHGFFFCFFPPKTAFVFLLMNECFCSDPHAPWGVHLDWKQGCYDYLLPDTLAPFLLLGLSSAVQGCNVVWQHMSTMFHQQHTNTKYSSRYGHVEVYLNKTERQQLCYWLCDFMLTATMLTS